MLIMDEVRRLVEKKIKARERRLRAAAERRMRAAEMCLQAAEEICCGGAACFPERVRRRSSAQPNCGRPSRHAKLDDFLAAVGVPSTGSRPPNLNAANLSFAARVVLAVRDRFDGDAPAVYNAARISRQAYSQIVSDETRPVSKRTAIRFAFALKLSKAEAVCLLKSAGYAFSNSQTEDFILQACLEVDPPIWDLDAVNMLLKEYCVDFQY